MGQLLRGKTLSWNETKSVASSMRKAAIRQLILSYKKNKSQIKPLSSLKWGYEIEYQILKIDNDQIKPFPCSHEILDFLNRNGNVGIWNPEYASFMVESIPFEPFDLVGDESKERDIRNSTQLDDQEMSGSLGWTVQNTIEQQVLFLKASLLKLYGSNVFPCAIGSYPLLGAQSMESVCQFSLSRKFPTKFINEHPRFATLTRNIVERRNKPISYDLPIFKDSDTKAESIHIDAMGFGMGCCCLQTTTEMESFDEACRIYDELLVFAPIALALTASSPAFLGLLSAHDTRWKVLENAVDDRNSTDMDCLDSRYSPSKFYLYGKNSQFNDIEIPFNQEAYNSFISEGIPENFAKHYAHIFYRDPLIAYEGSSYDNPSSDDTVFIDALQSTNWNSVRFKLPVPGTGCRIEFRPMEVQPSSFENCAFSILIEGLILTLVKSSKNGFNVSFTVPISQILQNFEKAVLKDSIITQEFNWSVASNNSSDSLSEDVYAGNLKEPELKTINQIMNDESSGILPLIKKHVPEYYLENEKYFEFIRKRASGEYETPARRIRKLILAHPDYRNDSVISDSIMISILNDLKNETALF